MVTIIPLRYWVASNTSEKKEGFAHITHDGDRLSIKLVDHAGKDRMTLSLPWKEGIAAFWELARNKVAKGVGNSIGDIVSEILRPNHGAKGDNTLS